MPRGPHLVLMLFMLSECMDLVSRSSRARGVERNSCSGLNKFVLSQSNAPVVRPVKRRISAEESSVATVGLTTS
jgi:hypothetical protein